MAPVSAEYCTIAPAFVAMRHSCFLARLCGMRSLPKAAGAGFRFHLVHKGVVDVCD